MDRRITKILEQLGETEPELPFPATRRGFLVRGWPVDAADAHKARIVRAMQTGINGPYRFNKRCVTNHLSARDWQVAVRTGLRGNGIAYARAAGGGAEGAAALRHLTFFQYSRYLLIGQ
jgi:hypothetical protein